MRNFKRTYNFREKYKLNVIAKLFQRLKKNKYKRWFVKMNHKFLYNVWYRNIPKHSDVIFVDPQKIIYSIKNAPVDNDLFSFGLIKNGDWDLFREEFEKHPKHLGLKEHFLDGVIWEDTVLFKSHYAQRFSNEGSVLKCKDMEQLKELYEDRIDNLFINIKQNGFKMPENHFNITDFMVFIGRDGEIMTGKDGNHRLSIAKLLQINKIPSKVVVRHKEWIKKRRIWAKNPKLVKPSLKKHPDLFDILTE